MFNMKCLLFLKTGIFALKWLYINLEFWNCIPCTRRTRHGGHCWRSREELMRDILLWNPSHGRANAGRPARTYIQQLCADTECSLEDLPEAMDNRRCKQRGPEISVLIARHDGEDSWYFQFKSSCNFFLKSFFYFILWFFLHEPFKYEKFIKRSIYLSMGSWRVLLLQFRVGWWHWFIFSSGNIWD